MQNQIEVTKYFPYECSRLPGPPAPLIRVPLTPALNTLRNQLSKSIGVQPDNKVAFECLDEHGELFGLRFWDNQLFIMFSPVPGVPGHKFFACEPSGCLKKCITPKENPQQKVSVCYDEM